MLDSMRSSMIVLLFLFCVVGIQATDLANNLSETKTGEFDFYATTRWVGQQFTTTATDADITEVHVNLFVDTEEAESGLYHVEIWGYNTTTFKPTTKIVTVAESQAFPTSRWYGKIINNCLAKQENCKVP